MKRGKKAKSILTYLLIAALFLKVPISVSAYDVVLSDSVGQEDAENTSANDSENTNNAENTDNTTDKDDRMDTPDIGCDGQFPWLFMLRIEYELNGGKNHRKNYRTVEKGDTLTLQDPTKKGYIFKGWYTDREYTHKVTKLVSKGGEDITLYAKWEKVRAGKESIISLKSSNSKKAKLKFKKMKNASGYEVLYGTDKNLNKRGNRLSVNKNTVTLKNLQDKTYYVKVRAYWMDSTGKKIYGKYSAIKQIVKK